MHNMMAKNLNENKYQRFIGKWKINLNGDNLFIEFGKGGTFNCYGKNDILSRFLVFSEEYNQILALHNKIKISSSWDLKNGKLSILISTREKTYDYVFSENDRKLTLINNETGEKLSFIRDYSKLTIDSLVSWYLKFKVIFAFLSAVIIIVILEVLYDLGIEIRYILVVFLVLVGLTIIIFLYVWLKIIIPRLKQ